MPINRARPNNYIALYVVYCNGPGRKIFVMRKLSTNRHYRLVGCSDKTIVPYAA